MDNTQKAVRVLVSLAIGTGISAVAMTLGMPWLPKWEGRVLWAITILALTAAGIIAWGAAQ